MIPRSTTPGLSAVLGEVAKGMEIDEIVWECGIKSRVCAGGDRYAARDRLKKLFNPGKPMMVHVRAICSKINGGARDISK
jgi:hypothetical protein